MNKFLIQPLKRLFAERAFLICVLVLGISAASMEICKAKLGMYLRKKPVSLRKPFDQLDESILYPYRVVRKEIIESEEVISELGTDEYIQWHLEDSSSEKNDPISRMLLFITYYTGDPGKVPHVPEVCYTGSGGSIRSTQSGKIRVENIGVENDELSVRIIRIANPSQGGNREMVVVYFFGVNGGFASNRSQLRFLLNSFLEQYAYFSKVEFVFNTKGKLTDKQVLKSVEKLTGKFLKVLIEEHWPKWPVEG